MKVGSDPITTSRKVELKEEKRRVWDRGGSPGKQDVERNNPTPFPYTLHFPSLQNISRGFMGPLLGANISEIQLKEKASQSYWAKGAKRCLCSTADERRENKRNGHNLTHTLDIMEVCQVFKNKYTDKKCLESENYLVRETVSFYHLWKMCKGFRGQHVVAIKQSNVAFTAEVYFTVSLSYMLLPLWVCYILFSPPDSCCTHKDHLQKNNKLKSF